MPTLLHLDASLLETSVSRELAREFVATWKTANPDRTAFTVILPHAHQSAKPDVRTVAVGGAAQLASGAVDRATLLGPELEQIRASAA